MPDDQDVPPTGGGAKPEARADPPAGANRARSRRQLLRAIGAISAVGYLSWSTSLLFERGGHAILDMLCLDLLYLVPLAILGTIMLRFDRAGRTGDPGKVASRLVARVADNMLVAAGCLTSISLALVISFVVWLRIVCGGRIE